MIIIFTVVQRNLNDIKICTKFIYLSIRCFNKLLKNSSEKQKILSSAKRTKQSLFFIWLLIDPHDSIQISQTQSVSSFYWSTLSIGISLNDFHSNIYYINISTHEDQMHPSQNLSTCLMTQVINCPFDWHSSHTNFETNTIAPRLLILLASLFIYSFHCLKSSLTKALFLSLPTSLTPITCI